MIIIQRTGITKNNDRLANINNEVKYAAHSKQLNYNLYTPVPIDIAFQVTIVSKRQGDIDRALSNFLPFFNKDAFIRYKHPKFDGLFMKCQVIMEDSITEEHPDSFDAATDDLVACTCTFVFKTWIFCGNDVISSKGNYVRHKISVDLSTHTSSVVDTEYNGFVPIIRQINIGFYPVPLLSSYIPHIDWVDALEPQGYDETPYVDRLIWRIDETDGDMLQVGNSYNYPPFSSDFLSNYYDERRTTSGFISGQLSSYNYLSGPDEAHRPLEQVISVITV